MALSSTTASGVENKNRTYQNMSLSFDDEDMMSKKHRPMISKDSQHDSFLCQLNDFFEKMSSKKNKFSTTKSERTRKFNLRGRETNA